MVLEAGVLAAVFQAVAYAARVVSGGQGALGLARPVPLELHRQATAVGVAGDQMVLVVGLVFWQQPHLLQRRLCHLAFLHVFWLCGIEPLLRRDNECTNIRQILIISEKR